jgi:HEPN domain-containing protein
MKDTVVMRWLKKAENDLKVVKYLVDIEDSPLDIICFHCQQAVEKYLKAYLTWINIRITKTHDLESILNLCINADEDFKTLDKDKISELTLYAVTVRYPEEYLEPSFEETKEFLKIALEVKDFVVKKLNEEGLTLSD